LGVAVADVIEKTAKEASRKAFITLSGTGMAYYQRVYR
jgi:hypothetical protein